MSGRLWRGYQPHEGFRAGTLPVGGISVRRRLQDDAVPSYLRKRIRDDGVEAAAGTDGPRAADRGALRARGVRRVEETSLGVEKVEGRSPHDLGTLRGGHFGKSKTSVGISILIQLSTP